MIYALILSGIVVRLVIKIIVKYLVKLNNGKLMFFMALQVVIIYLILIIVMYM